jgi:prepilin-type N-terminal cleavage/methylation domain-containing protein
MKKTRGFTLIEMAIVLVIITILIGGLAMPLSAQIQARRIAETKKIMEEAREAILGYAMTHSIDHDGDADTPPRPYLPCPDREGDGIENRNAGVCTQEIGWFPWVTLGTAAQDAWGNRLRYATHNDLTRAVPNVSTSGFHNGSALAPTTPWNQVCTEEDCPDVDIAADVPVVLISHGANGWGALNVNANTLASPSSANELENLDWDKFFISRTPSKPGDASGEFDDLVTWLSFNVLINRACPAASGCP